MINRTMANGLYCTFFLKSNLYSFGRGQEEIKILNKSKIPMPKLPISLKDLILRHEYFPRRCRTFFNLCFL